MNRRLRYPLAASFRSRRSLLVWILSCVSLVIAPPAVGAAQEEHPFLHALFSDHMVLQRGVEAPVWGWTAPGSRVTVRVAGKEARATAGADGKWIARLGPLEAGGPHELRVEGPKSVTLHDVLVGDVWLCSGQSNMEMGIGIAGDAAAEIAAADHPRLRLFTVPKRIAFEPRENVDGRLRFGVGDFPFLIV